MLGISLITKDLNHFFEFESLYRTEFIISFTMVALFGLFLNLATFNCTMKNSPFAIALTHNIKVKCYLILGYFFNNIKYYSIY